MEVILENGLMSALSGLFGTYIILRLAACFLNRRRENRAARILPCLLCFVLIGAGHFLFGNFWLIIGCYGGAILLMGTAYEDDTDQKLLYVANSALVVVGVQVLMALLMGGVGKNNSGVKYDEQLMVNAVEYIAAMMIGKAGRSRTAIRIPKIYWAAVVLVPVSSMYVFSMLYKAGSLTPVEILIAALALLGVDYCIILLYEALTAAYRRTLEQALLAEQNRYYASQLKSLSEAYNTIRSVKHDIKGNLNAIRVLAEEGRTQEIVDYVGGINEAPGFNMKYVDTGNLLIDGILNYEKQQAVNTGVRMEFTKIIVMEKMDYNEFDMSIVLGNLLDNAITAAAPLEEEGYVQVYMEQRRDRLRIEVCNPFRHTLKKDRSGRFLSTKEDAANHGIGLGNVRKIVEKYDGSIRFNTDHQIFKVEVILRT